MSPRASRPSQRMIAELANVSQSAVSMVVSGQADANRIPQATQDRIRQIMREVGYVPNVAARLLRSQRNGLVGVHTYERVFPIREEDYYHDFLVGIEAEAVEQGVDLVLFTSTLRADGTRAVYNDGMNRLRLADGAIFFGLEKDDSELTQLARDGYPFVFIGKRAIEGTDIPFVTADYAGGIAATLDVLQEAGHRSIRYLASTQRALPQHERLEAFTAEVTARGLRDGIVEAPADEIRDRLDEILDGVTAVLVETVELADALHGALAERGVRVPADLGVVVLDASPPNAAAAAWSHVGFPRREMGAAAVRLLLAWLEAGVVPESVTLPVAAPDPRSVGSARSAD
ncbi:LacI family DNA-binding transcriptional regulator [Microbacterium oryzae]|nr:LacI family DNA-binding transcriptional regulator [Microbacterium oryzae]